MAIALESTGPSTAVRIGALVLHFAATQLVAVEIGNITALRRNDWGDVLQPGYDAVVATLTHSPITTLDRGDFTGLVSVISQSARQDALLSDIGSYIRSRQGASSD